MSADLIAHRGAQIVTREALAQYVPPPATETFKPSPFNMIIFAQEAWRSRRAFRSDTRCAQGAFSWDREDASDIATGSPMTPTHPTHWRIPCQRVLERAPNAARESQSSCRRRYGQFLRTDNSSRPRH